MIIRRFYSKGKALVFIGIVVFLFLVGLGGYQMIGARERNVEQGKVGYCILQMENIQAALEMYHQTHGQSYPESLSEIVPDPLVVMPFCVAKGAEPYAKTYKVELTDFEIGVAYCPADHWGKPVQGSCRNKLKGINLALTEYAQSNPTLPPKESPIALGSCPDGTEYLYRNSGYTTYEFHCTGQHPGLEKNLPLCTPAGVTKSQ